MQSYAIFRPIANFLAFISPTCSDRSTSVACYQRDARIVSTGDKLSKLPQNLTYEDDYYIFFLKICLSFEIIHYLCKIQ